MDYKTEPKQQEPQLICLCAACASAFYNVPTIKIKRADRYQFVKDSKRADPPWTQKRGG